MAQYAVPGKPEGRRHKLRRTGRHSTPSHVQQVARQASKAAPAVAVVGALAAAPHIYQATPARAAVTTGHARVAHRTPATGASGLLSDRVLAAPANAAWFKTDTYRHRHARPAPAVRHDAARLSALQAGQAAPAAPAPPGPATGRHRAPDTGVQCAADAAGPVPENYAQIVSFLTTHGYGPVAAAGIAGNIYQESGGNPESDGGLIGWTPLPAGLVTGDPEADLQAQLAAILVFNNQFPADITVLNEASSPAAAADVYVTDFERAGDPMTWRREAAAEAVAQACGI
jgi:hypothetical protein